MPMMNIFKWKFLRNSLTRTKKVLFLLLELFLKNTPIILLDGIFRSLIVDALVFYNAFYLLRLITFFLIHLILLLNII